MSDDPRPAGRATVTIEPEKAATALRQLAAELEGRRFSARLRTKEGTPPCLTVINLAAPALADSVLVAVDADDEWCFFFPWPERIAPVGDVMAAADRIERVLAEIDR
ncbi:hypothetical protein GCM10010466_08850 [Planomonospora alba]|uniref:Uncharacterized protein n=1 Tax=Planomonospora alba TaxID=161354 RepID=A0ABP6MNA7_9ACTN